MFKWGAKNSATDDSIQARYTHINTHMCTYKCGMPKN